MLSLKIGFYAFLLFMPLIVAARAAPPASSPDFELFDTFQVMCVMPTPFSFDRFNQIAALMQMPLLASHSGRDELGGNYREKDWIGMMGATPFVQAIRIDVQASRSQTQCAIETRVPDGEAFRLDFVKLMELGAARKVALGTETDFYWDGQFGPGTSLALHERLPATHPESVELALTGSPTAASP